MRYLGVLLSGGICLSLTGCGNWPGTDPTDTPDKVWCNVRATQCVLWTQTANGTPLECLQWRVDSNGVSELLAQNPPEGQWRCFDSAEKTAQERCDELCNGLSLVLHPPVRDASGQIIPNALRCVTDVVQVETGECLRSSSSALSVMPGPENSPDFHSSAMTGSGSLASASELKTVSVTGGSLSLKAPDPTCANSPAGECRVRLNALELRYADFTFKGRSISDLTVFLAEPVDNIATPIGGSNEALFSLLPGTVFHATGLLDGARTNVVVETLTEVTGMYDHVTGAVTVAIDFSGSLAGEAVSGTAMATSDTVSNRPPSVDAGPDITVVAENSCTAAVTLDGSGTSDPDGNLDTINLIWTRPDESLGSGVTLPLDLAIGEHAITLHAMDTSGAYGFDNVHVTVMDGNLPEFVDPEPSIRLHSCQPGPSELAITPPDAMNLCSSDAPAVSGRVISINGQAVSIAITGNTVQLPAGTSHIEWTATNANGSVTFVQTVEVAAEPTLFASGELSVGKRVQVLADGVGFGTAMSTGTQRTRLGPDMEVGDVYTLPDIKVLDRATIHGTLHHAGAVQLGSGVSIGATIFDADFWQPQVPALPEFAGGAAINVAPGRAASAPAGNYGDVVVKSRARLRLSSGVYMFDALDLHADAALEVPVDGSARVYVKDALSFRGTVKTSSNAAAPLFLGYAGTSNATIAAPFWGVILAPNARLVLATAGADQQHSGRFYARQLDVRSAARVVHDNIYCQ